jgi:cardiolipin synthase
VVVDAIGSRFFPETLEKDFIKEGGFFFRFNRPQLKWPHRWGRRLHHKVLLIDQVLCIVGGINVHSPCVINTSVPRLDFAILLRGPILYKLHKYLRMILRRSFSKHVKLLNIINSTIEFRNGIEVGMSVNDWVYGHRIINEQYSKNISNAQKEINIINSYFFPRRKFMKQLAAAAERGVRVRLILPTFSDWPSYIKASEYLYSYFLKNNIEIYRWSKSILHGKLATVDNSWLTVGSYNLNYTSYQQNLEININVNSEQFTSKINEEIETLITDGCDQITTENFLLNCSRMKKLERFFYYLILSIIANFSVGLTFQEENNKENKIINIFRIIGAILFFVLGIVGVLLPIIPGIPFLIISFSLVYRQILLNKNKN